MLSLVVKASVRHAGVVIALALVLLAYGGYRLATASLDIFPEFSPRLVIVQTEAPGYAAEQVERLVSRPVEAALGGLIGIESVRSQSNPGPLGRQRDLRRFDRPSGGAADGRRTPRAARRNHASARQGAGDGAVRLVLGDGDDHRLDLEDPFAGRASRPRGLDPSSRGCCARPALPTSMCSAAPKSNGRCRRTRRRCAATA